MSIQRGSETRATEWRGGTHTWQHVDEPGGENDPRSKRAEEKENGLEPAAEDDGENKADAGEGEPGGEDRCHTAGSAGDSPAGR